MSKLALFGGPKVRIKLFPSQNTYDHEEMQAVRRIMKSGRLSWYRGNWGKEFYGGPEIRALEHEWQEKFNVKHAICCNSATSGLFIAMGALGLEKGGMVIVTPYSMTCSATIPLAWGLTPTFADVERNCFCLDYDSVKQKMNDQKMNDSFGKPKAIIAVSLFGQPFDPRLKEFGLPIIEDAAQALGSFWDGEISKFEIEEVSLVSSPPESRAEVGGIVKERKRQYAGTLGDIGVYSFNYGKHLTCGEGGMIVTDNEELALKCRLIMNHGESVINDASLIEEFMKPDIKQIFGFNLRMTEVQAVIVRTQLKKLNQLLGWRTRNVEFLQSSLSGIPAITIPPVRPRCTHTYYVLPFLWDQEKAEGIHRDRFIEAVKAELTPREGRDTEGIQIGCGYIKPINKMEVFHSRGYKDELPNVEKLWKDKLFLTLYHAPNSTKADMIDVIEAFHKVWAYREELR